MNMEKDLKQNSEGTKKKVRWGCLTTVVLILSPIILFVGWFSYDMYFKEVTLVKSHSPNNMNTIKVVQKGSAFLFGPSSVRIKCGWWEHLDKVISNDGKTLDSSNVSVSWENDYEATITLYGEEQEPEIIEFKTSNESNGAKFDSKASEEVQQEVGSFTFKTSESPNLINIIEFREIAEPRSSVRIYYGKRGSVLEKYKEFTLTEMYTPDNFNVDWESDEQVTIDIVRETESGNTYVEDTIEIELSK
ncbi:hypothetical protein [Priestia taiwanensis]|uniref:Uncharacterized protein n=1 Tax=Priestia taiwanensis TaxID=1347902 RepID=A0A917AKF5_9BACI|nr:hypothetical protein [Priestia taiwanensis]MBM7362057.1 hypothetical protein [Priestia taiwanensis]GGE59111.1 hypothetical protein GCM10007140_06820 [Priestia taiwanensis]